MTMMMMQRLLQNNNNNNNGYADETRLNGIRHHSASPFSKPAAVQAAAAPGTAVTAAVADGAGGGSPDAPMQRSPVAGVDQQQQQQQPSAQQSSETWAVKREQTDTAASWDAVKREQTDTCNATVQVAAVQAAAAEADDRLTSDEDDELNVDEDPVDLTNNRLHGTGACAAQSRAADKPGTAAACTVPMDTAAANDYETSGGAPCSNSNKGRLAFSVENILDPNKFTKKLISPAAVLPRWRPRVDFAADPSIAGESFSHFRQYHRFFISILFCAYCIHFNGGLYFYFLTLSKTFDRKILTPALHSPLCRVTRI